MADTAPAPVTPLDRGAPVYVQATHATITKDGEVLEIRAGDGARITARLAETTQLVLIGNVSITTPVLHELLRREIPVSWHGASGWFLGHTVGIGHGNVALRIAQHRAAAEPRSALEIARPLVAAKIANGRTLLRRHLSSRCAAEPIGRLADLTRRTVATQTLDELRGIEGAAAAAYYAAFGETLAPPRHGDAAAFRFSMRQRRPPDSPVNALLSFCYALLVRHWTVVLSATGFDPHLGFLHQPRHGRPALALDMMEPFRPLLADSTVLRLVNHGEIHDDDFVREGDAVLLGPSGRKTTIAAFEQRLDRMIRHPTTGQRMTYRRSFAEQGYALARLLTGAQSDFPQIVGR